MNSIDKILKQKKLMVLDGALATELERHGLSIKDEMWSARILVENPAMIEDVHYSYYCAGADACVSASYQATVKGFMKKGFTETQSRDLICRSMELLFRARERFWKDKGEKEGRIYPLAGASIGPYGAYLADGSEYSGNYGIPYRDLVDFHKERIQMLIKTGADMLAIETLPSLEEARAILEAIGTEEIPVLMSFSCRNEREISDGTPLFLCAKELDLDKRIVALGVNCTSPKYIPALIQTLKANTRKPILVYPNSGEEYDPIEKVWKGNPEGSSYGEMAKLWYELGARLIGGCCRTTPYDIEQVAMLSKKLGR